MALQPSNEIQYLGVIINSKTMTVHLTDERKKKLAKSCKEVQKKKNPSIREVARAIGIIVASFPAVKYGPLFYRSLEEDKKNALKIAKGNFDRVMTVSNASKTELQWWIDNIDQSSNDVRICDPDVTMTSDASLTGWGCSFNGSSSGGSWSDDERLLHINVLEIKAAYFALQCFSDQIKGKHVRLMVDNTTAVACINNMGTNHSYECNHMTFQLWKWCIDNNVWVSTAYIASSDNVVADKESRRSINPDIEYSLLKSEFTRVTSKLDFVPTVDLFANRLNAQLKSYVSFRPDPGAMAVDAFSLDWGNLKFYAFPPFCLLTKVIQKIIFDKAEGILIAPLWPTQPWYAMLDKIIIMPACFISRGSLIPDHRVKSVRMAAYRVCGSNFQKMD